MPNVSSLGHVGLFCTDLQAMRDFYTRVLGMTVTDEGPERGMVFLSARPADEHHELLLMRGRTGGGDALIVQQISFHVDSLDELRAFHAQFEAEGVPIDSVVTHGNTASVYFRDPEGNRLEVYYSLPVEWPQPFRANIDLTADNDGVLRQIHDATFGAAAR